jgi:hypothetical protein
MNSVICTLFEGNYHYGLGALANSLYFHGYRGTMWAGYRGNLPPWAHPLERVSENVDKYQLSKDCSICFIKLSINHHFTNFKPTFMLYLWEKYCPNAEAMFYFDPDIVTKCRWSFFEEWVEFGVALCEDVSSPILQNHPFRMQWKNMCKPHGFTLDKVTDVYVNGGFVGVKKDLSDFLVIWSKLLDLIAPEIGGLQNPKIYDITSMLRTPDQEALNMALMDFNGPSSIIAKEGMDFIYGGFTMSHAIGGPKPWKKAMALMALKGKPPRLQDKEYWKYTQYPIKLYSSQRYFFKKMDLLVGSIIGRIL